MQPRELVMIRGRRDLGDAGKQGVAPAVRIGAQASQSVANEATDQVRKPTLAVDGKVDARAPQPGT